MYHKNVRSVSVIFASLMAALAMSILPAAPKVYAADPTKSEFQLLCGVDHFGADDPIVYPNQPGASHMHSFYGNKSTNAATTATSLLTVNSSCGRNMQTSDKSAYWIPSMYTKGSNGSMTLDSNDGQLMFIYYRRAGGTTGPKVQAFPAGFKMIAGDSKATSAQPNYVVEWDCGGGGPSYSNIPTCATDTAHTLHASLDFPNCWDGKSLDSADHKSHMAYSDLNTGTCPADHPVSLPAIEYEINYPGYPGGPNAVLSSGGQYSMHGDFFNGWDSQVQNALVSSCLNTAHNCLDVNRNGNTLTYTETPGGGTSSINLSNFTATATGVLGDQTTSTTASSSTSSTQPTSSNSSSSNSSNSNTQNASTGSDPAAEDTASDQTGELPNTGVNMVWIFIATVLTGFLGFEFYVNRRWVVDTVKQRLGR